MYVIVVSTGYPTSIEPLKGIFAFDQIKALSVDNKVILIGVNLDSFLHKRKWGFEHIFKDEIEIYAVNIPLGRVPRKVLKFFGEWGIKKLYQKIKKDHGEPDIIHAHFLRIGEITLSLKGMTKSSKFVLTEHTSVLNDSLDRIPLWMKTSAKNIYSQFDKVIAVSPRLSNHINLLFDANSIAIPNMLDEVFLSAPVRNRKVGSYSFNFIFVGNLIERKQPLLCIESFNNAFKGSDFKDKTGRPIFLYIIGDGPERQKCIETINELKLDDNVFMFGRLERKMIAEKMRKCDCFVLPTKLETFGVVYIEAMACGLPVIATRCGGPESFVDETNGILIPVDDESALVSAFKYMLDNANKYDQDKISSNTVEKFSSKSVAKKIIDVYEDLMNDKQKNETCLKGTYGQDNSGVVK